MADEAHVRRRSKSLLAEGRTFPPPAGVRSAGARSSTPTVYDEAERRLARGSGPTQAGELARLVRASGTRSSSGTSRSRSGSSAASSTSPYNCLDRHVDAGHGDQVAYHWEGEPGDTRTITYARAARRRQPRSPTRSKTLGVEQGRPGHHLPGHGARAADGAARLRARSARRTRSCSAASPPTRCATASTTPRPRCSSPATARGGAAASSPLKETADEAVAECPTIEQVLVLRRTEHDVADDRRPRRLVARPRRPASRPSARPSRWTPRTCSTSSTRAAPPAKPKGIMHTTGGYLTQVACTHKYVFDLQPDTDVYWCTADVGWVTGHSYIVYGPLANRATSVIYEGTPDFPDKDRLWSDRREVQGHDPLHRAHRDPHVHEVGRRVPRSATTSRRCGCSASVGEPINPEAWVWYWKHIGGERCPVVDTWWQTETGAIMISPLPGATTLKPGQRDVPAPRHRRRHRRRRRRAGRHPRRRLPRAHPAVAVDAARHLGRPRALPRHVLVAASTARYFAGDGAKRDDDGYFWLLGRVDDVMLVVRPQHLDRRGRARARRPSRGRRGRGRRHEATTTTGQAIARVRDPARRQRAERRARRRAARPRRPRTSARSPSRRRSCSPRTCPKTRSGKIMRRLLRDVAEDQALGDTTTLADPSVVEGIKARYLAAGDRRRRVTLAPRRATSPSTGPGTTARSSPGRRSSSTSTACCPTPRSRQHYLEAPRRDWRRVLRRVRRRPGHRGGARCSSTCSTPSSRSCCSPPGPQRVHHLTEAWLRRYRIRWDLLHHAAVGRLRAGPRLQAGDRCGSCASYGFELRLAIEDDRRNVEMFRRRGRALHLLPLRLLRLTSRARGRVPVTTTSVIRPSRARAATSAGSRRGCGPWSRASGSTRTRRSRRTSRRRARTWPTRRSTSVSVRKNWLTSHAAPQFTAVATATARPRTWLGKISLITVHTTGPSENAKLAMNTTIATSMTTPASLGVFAAPRCRSVARRGSAEADRDRREADRHPDEAGEQQRPAAEAVDERHRDERGQHVHRADRPRGGRGLVCGRVEPGGGEDLVRVVDDRVDAGELLEDREADTEHRAARATASRTRRATTPARHRASESSICVDHRVGVLVGLRRLRARATASSRRPTFCVPARRVGQRQHGEEQQHGRGRPTGRA